MKILIMTLRERVERFTDFNKLPSDWEYIWAGYGKSVDELVGIAKDADAVLVDAISPLSGELIRHMPNLKIIHSEGVGYEAIDIKAARECGVDVCNNKGANKKAVAEQAVMLMLAVLRREITGHERVLCGKQIQTKSDWSKEGIHELGSMHVGIAGMGDIGFETAKLCRAFGCKVSYNKRHRLAKEIEDEHGFSYLPIEEMLSTCDILSLHIPAGEQTNGFMNRERFEMMKRGSILINTARGEVVDNEAMLWALKSGQIAAVGLDVLSPEPVESDNVIIQAVKADAALAEKITLAPHIGGLTIQTFEKIYDTIWDNFARADRGEKPVNVVN